MGLFKAFSNDTVPAWVKVLAQRVVRQDKNKKLDTSHLHKK